MPSTPKYLWAQLPTSTTQSSGLVTRICLCGCARIRGNMVCPSSVRKCSFLPLLLGMPRDVVVDDPQLGTKRTELATLAATKLADAGMIIFGKHDATFSITDLGRIAAKYYVRYLSIEIFNKQFRSKMSEADVLAMLAMSTEVRRAVGCSSYHSRHV